MDRYSLKEKELQVLFEEYKKNPELFQKQTFIEGPELLQGLGIFIKNKENFPQGYLKFLPQDFIVEEIGRNGEIYTVDCENILGPETEIKDNEETPTVYATLVKCNVSTLEAIEDLAKHLNCELKQIQFAGIKDKNAITSQRISFRGISVEDLKKISSPFFFLKDVSLGKGVVEKGGLEGNRFTILVRTIEPVIDDKGYNDFIANLERIRSAGFYNFFYLQRFGTPRLVNFRWGCDILKGDYKKAVYNFLSDTNERESRYFQKLRAEIKAKLGDWPEVKKILERFPLIFVNELKIANYLEKNSPTSPFYKGGQEGDFRGALAQLPDQVTLWVYAFSSWLFNAKISEYIKNEAQPPDTLPLFLSYDRADWEPYKEMLEEYKLMPPLFVNLKPFNIQIKDRHILTRDFVKIHKGQILEEGAVLSFSLSKGSYATTFLSHLFNLLVGEPPAEIRGGEIDLKKEIKDGTLGPVVERFRDLIHAKSENIFETMGGK